MGKKIKLTTNAIEILEQLKQPKDRKQTSVYLSESAWQGFKQNCGEISASLVLERLVMDFNKRCDGTSD